MCQGGVSPSSFALLATPFEEDGGVDLFAFDRLLCHVQRGTGGVAVGFPEGEGESLSPDEFGLLLKEATLFFSGRRQVAAGCFGASTEGVARLAQAAAQAGADLLYLPPPYGVSAGDGGYFCHLNALCSVGLPFLALMPRQGTASGRPSLIASEIARLSCFAGFLVGGLEGQDWGLWHSAHPETPLYMKNDCLSLPALFAGFCGAFSPLSCLLPEEFSLLMKKCKKNDPSARELLSALFPLCALLSGRDGGALLKWGLHKSGVLSPAMRLPRVLPEGRVLADFERALEEGRRGARRFKEKRGL